MPMLWLHFENLYVEMKELGPPWICQWTWFISYEQNVKGNIISLKITLFQIIRLIVLDTF